MLSPTQQRRYGSEYSYWANAEMEARVQVRSLKSEADLAMREDVGEGRLTATEWWATDEGIRILEHIEAATLEADIYAKQDDRVKQGSAEACAFTSLFAETKLGLGIRKPSKSQRLEFRESLIQFYNAAVGTHPRNPKHFLTLHDTAGGQNMICSSVTAVYLVPYKLNSDLRAVIYGEDVEDEIMRPWNGLLLQNLVARGVSNGALAIVPDLPDDPTTEQVKAWEASEPKEYKWRVFDDDAECHNECGDFSDNWLRDELTTRELDGRRLSFNNANRPKPRYLYFLFVVALLKMAWRHKYYKQKNQLTHELAKIQWGRPNQYLSEGLLSAVGKEIGYTLFPPGTHEVEPGSSEQIAGDIGLIAISKIIRAEAERKAIYEPDWLSEDEEEDNEKAERKREYNEDNSEAEDEDDNGKESREDSEDDWVWAEWA